MLCYIVRGPHLCRHVHEQHCSHRRLSLAVSLIRPIDGVGFQDPVQILLPAGTKHPNYPAVKSTKTLKPSVKRLLLAHEDVL